MEGIQTLKGSWPWPWPSIRPYGISSCSSHRPLPIYIPTFIQIEETFCGRTDVRTDGRTDIFPLYTIRSTFGSRPKNYKSLILFCISPSHPFFISSPHLITASFHQPISSLLHFISLVLIMSFTFTIFHSRQFIFISVTSIIHFSFSLQAKNILYKVKNGTLIMSWKV